MLFIYKISRVISCLKHVTERGIKMKLMTLSLQCKEMSELRQENRRGKATSSPTHPRLDGVWYFFWLGIRGIDGLCHKDRWELYSLKVTVCGVIAVHCYLASLWFYRFLQQSLRNKSLQMNDYKIALLCNAYSTNSECFTLPMGVLVETIYGNGNMRIPLPGTNCMASGSITPLPMNLLDSLTVHAKMRYSVVSNGKLHKRSMSEHFSREGWPS